MKKTIALVISFVLLFFCAISGVSVAEGGQVNVVATIFPVYDWVREVVGDGMDHINLTLLLDSGVDLHSYQPTAQDILTISTADLFIYVGGESDEWVEDVLTTAMNPDLKAINLVEAMGEDIKAEEIVEGMEHEHDHDEEDEDHDHEEHDHEGEEEADEHVWLSLRNAQKLVNVIAGKLSEIDPENGDRYRANAAAYNEKLAALDRQYLEVAENAAVKTVLFGDRFPFRYLADDYGLSYYAAFAGCSAETEASFETILFLAEKVDELGLKTVLKLDNTDGRIAETVINTTRSKDQKIVTMNSMQTVTAQDVQNGARYLAIMEENLEAMKEALR